MTFPLEIHIRVSRENQEHACEPLELTNVVLTMLAIYDSRFKPTQ